MSIRFSISCSLLTRWFCVITLLLAGHVLSLRLVHAQAITPVHTKLTPDNARFGLYDVAPNGRFVIYPATLGAAIVSELYSVPLTGGTSIKLNVPLLENEALYHYKFTPDSAHVVYSIQNNLDKTLKIYSVPTAGGDSQRLSISEPTGMNIIFNPRLGISPDSQRIVYEVESESSSTSLALISVAISGGQAITVTPPLVEGGTIFQYRFSRNGSQVLYAADQETKGRVALYAVPASGGTPVNLSGTLDAGMRIGEIIWTADQDRIVYTPQGDSTSDMFSVSLSGGVPVQLDNSTEVVRGVIWAASDNSKLVYFTGYEENEVQKYKLYSNAPSGGNAVVLSSTELAGGTANAVSNVAITNDNKRVVFSITISGKMSLYSVPIGGGDLLKLGGPASRYNSYFTMKNFSDEAIYFDGVDNATAFLQVSATTAQSQTIGSTIDPFSVVTVTPDDGYLIYYTDNSMENFILPLAGGTPTRFTVELQAGEYIDPFDDFTPVLINNQICQVYALTLHGNGHREAIYSSCVPALEIDWPYNVYLPTVAR